MLKFIHIGRRNNTKYTAKKRGYDAWGAGHFGAPRGKRTHAGQDYLCGVSDLSLAVKSGTVTKIGTVYIKDTRYKYVQVTDNKKYKLRYYYLHALVSVGQHIEKGQVLGSVQDLGAKYKNIPIHVHFEIKKPTGYQRIDPLKYIGAT